MQKNLIPYNFILKNTAIYIFYKNSHLAFFCNKLNIRMKDFLVYFTKERKVYIKIFINGHVENTKKFKYNKTTNNNQSYVNNF